MIELYFQLVKAGKRTIGQVPERYRTDVQALQDAVKTDLLALGLDENGNPINA